MTIMRTIIRLLIAAAFVRVAGAGNAHLVADLAPESVKGSISPGGPVVTIGDDVYFEAVDRTHLGQVWRTNGAPGDLKRLTEIEGGGVRSLAAFEGSLYFFGFETPGVKLRKITPPAEDAEIVAAFRDADEITAIGGAFVFGADDGVHGWEPWRSDGTLAGTTLLSDLVPGSAGSNASGFATANGAFAFFFAATDAGQAALWRTDGTPSGTQRIAGFGAPPADGFRPDVLGVVGGRLVFTTWKGSNRFALWSSDGTPAGTAPIAEFAGDFIPLPIPFPYEGPSSNGTSAGGFLYFTANDGVHGREPWRTDGTSVGTSLVADIYPGETGSEGAGVAAIGDSIILAAFDPVHGTEPWIATAGTPGARLIRDIHPGPQGIAYGFLAAGNAVYFTADDGVSGAEPWRTDGTENGTFRVADIAPGPAGSQPGFFFAKDGEAFLLANSGEGPELWKTDGSEGGTIVVEDLAGPASSYPGFEADVLGRLFFSTVTGENGDTAYRRLWVTRGAPGTTVHVRDFALFGPSGFAPASFLAVGGRLMFAADDGVHGNEPWLSDGTGEGTFMIADVAPGTADSNPYSFTPFRGKTVFFADASSTGHPQLEETDGTTPGTRLIADISPKAAFYGTPILPFGTDLFFAATDGSGTELWRSDGTAAGTVSVKAIGPDGIYRMTIVGGDFYFASGSTLWKSDGTSEGTLPVFTSEESIDTFQIETARGLVFFLAGNSSALWRTDGTDAGTFPVADAAYEPTAAGNLVFFIHDDGIHGSELWRTDGTVDGTLIVRDIRPGSVGSYPGDFASAGDSLYFSASDGVHGWEPWRSDGTAEGTVLVADILPGIGSSHPARFVRSGAWMYFAADDGSHGNELWAAPAGPARPHVVAPAPPLPPARVIRPPSP
jgi:ELWxxDGT repeat protein